MVKMTSNASPPTLPSPPELAENKRRAINAIKAYLNNTEKNKTVANLEGLISKWGNNNKLAGMTTNNTTKIGLARIQLNALRAAAKATENAKNNTNDNPNKANFKELVNARAMLANAVAKLTPASLVAMSPETRTSLYAVIKSELTPRPGFVNSARALFARSRAPSA